MEFDLNVDDYCLECGELLKQMIEAPNGKQKFIRHITGSEECRQIRDGLDDYEYLTEGEE